MKFGNSKNYKDLKVKPGEVLFIPSDNRHLEMPPTVNTSSNPPGWFRKMGKFPGSVRRCAGTIDYLAAGVSLPAWSNFKFKNKGSGSIWEVATDQLDLPGNYPITVQSFDFAQTGKCPMSEIRDQEVQEGCYPKLVKPWRIKTAPGWSTLILPNLFEPNKNWTVVPAIVHTDFYHTLNVVLNIHSNEDFAIHYGDPLVQLIPFKRDSDFNKVLFEDEKMFKYVSSRGFGSGSLIPTPGESTARPYRMERIKVDKQIEEEKSKRKWKKNK